MALLLLHPHLSAAGFPTPILLRSDFLPFRKPIKFPSNSDPKVGKWEKIQKYFLIRFVVPASDLNVFFVQMYCEDVYAYTLGRKT